MWKHSCHPVPDLIALVSVSHKQNDMMWMLLEHLQWCNSYLSYFVGPTNPHYFETIQSILTSMVNYKKLILDPTILSHILIFYYFTLQMYATITNIIFFNQRIQLYGSMLKEPDY